MLVGISSSPPISSTDKANSNNNELEKLEMIALDLINVYLTTSEISSNPPKCFQGLTQWALVPLGPTLIYNANKTNSIL